VSGRRFRTSPQEAQEGASTRAIPYRDSFELIVEQQAATLLLHLAGEFDLSTIGRVEAALDRALRALTRHVVFDLRNVSFLDLAGLMTLMRANERSHHASFDVQIVPPAGLARRVFTLTRAGTELTMLAETPG
jgi:anti-anti-sigma factor